MQPFGAPRTTNIPPAQTKRPIPGAMPGARIPGPQPGIRPGAMKTGPPGPIITRPQPPMTGAPNSQIPPISTTTDDQPKTLLSVNSPAINSPFELKSEALRAEIQKKDKGVPTVQSTFSPKVDANPKPANKEPDSLHPPHQTQSQPPITRSEFEPRPIQKFPGPRGIDPRENRENINDQTSDQLVRLSESLQAMKSLRNNFQGFNVQQQPEPEDEEEEEQQGEEEEEEQNEADYEGGEEDDYVRVEDTEDVDTRQDIGADDNEDENNEEYDEQQVQEADYPEQREQISLEEPPIVPKMHNIRVETQAQINQREREYQAAEDADQVPEVFSAKKTPPRISEMKLASPQLKSPVVRPDLRSPNIKRPFEIKEVQRETEHEPNQGGGAYYRGDDSTHKSSDYERIEPGFKNDPSLLVQIQKLELELEKERKKNSVLENENKRIVDENISLKNKNHQINTRLEATSKRDSTERSLSGPEIEALKAELNRALTESRQSSQNSHKIIRETSQYREQTDSIINTLEEDKNRLYQQVAELRRQIDEEYAVQVESFRQKISLMESQINEYGSNFNLVQDQLRERSQTLQTVTALNSDIQNVLTSIPVTAPQSSNVPTSVQHKVSAVAAPKVSTAQAPKADIRSTQAISQQARPQSVAQPNSERKMSGTINATPAVAQQPKPVQQIKPVQHNVTNKSAVSEQVQIVPGNINEKLHIAETEEDRQPTPRKDLQQRENIEVATRQEPPQVRAPSSATIQKAAAKKISKNPFAEESAEDFFTNLASNAPASNETPQDNQQFEIGQEEAQHYPEAQDAVEELPPSTYEKPPASNFVPGKPNKGNLRYSQNTATQEREPTNVEAAENFFDQLGSSQVHSEPPPQHEVQPPTKQHQQQQQQQVSVKRGQNPFAEEGTQEIRQSQTQIHTQQQPQHKQQTGIQRGVNPFASEDTQEDLTHSRSQIQAPVKTQAQAQRSKNPFAEDGQDEQPVSRSQQVQAPGPGKVQSLVQKGRNPFASEELNEPIQSQISSQPQTQTQVRASTSIQKGKNPFASEDNYDDLRQSQSQIQAPINTQTPMQRGRNPFGSEDTQEDLTQSRSQIQPPVKTSSLLQKGKNPFAEEAHNNTSQSTNLMQSTQEEGFVSRLEANRPAQPKINAAPLQTAAMKKVDDSKTPLAAKSSALKKPKTNIPSSMFN